MFSQPFFDRCGNQAVVGEFKFVLESSSQIYSVLIMGLNFEMVLKCIESIILEFSPKLWLAQLKILELFNISLFWSLKLTVWTLEGLFNQLAWDCCIFSGIGRRSQSKALIFGFGLSLGLRLFKKVKSFSCIFSFLKYGLEYFVFIESCSKIDWPFLIFFIVQLLSRILSRSFQ